MRPDEARELFVAARVGRLTTVDEGGRPHVVPAVFAVRGSVLVIAVDDKPKAHRDLRRLRNIRANPAVSVLVDHYEEDWARLWWVRADGTARVLTEGFEAEIDWLVEKYEQYQRMRPAGPVIRLDVDRWTGWSATAR